MWCVQCTGLQPTRCQDWSRQIGLNKLLTKVRPKRSGEICPRRVREASSELHLNFTWHGNVGSVQSHSQTFNNFYPSSQEKTVFLKTNREHWRRSQMRSVPLARDDGPRLDTSISIVSLSSSSPRQLPPRPRLSLITGLDNWYCSVLALLSVPARDAQHNNYH